MKWVNMKICNPWSKVTLHNTFAYGDKNYIVKIKGVKMPFGSAQYINQINLLYPNSKLAFNCLPEPYSGNPDANVYCLNMNPGKPDPIFDKCLSNNIYFQRSLENLNHQVQSPFWTEDLVSDSCGTNIRIDPVSFGKLLTCGNTNNDYIHEGARWQYNKTKELRKALNRNPNIFFLEYFPYHSTSGFVFPDYLPSYDYRNELLEFAMKEGKIIFIMRKEREWYNIKYNNIGDRLKMYKKKVFLKNSQGGWLTRQNMVLPIPDNCHYCITWNDILSNM